MESIEEQNHGTCERKRTSKKKWKALFTKERNTFKKFSLLAM
jgi:hypothetical protein